MIPYIHVPDLKLGPATLHPFGLLVATGVIIGTALATSRARRLGVDLDRLNSFITWMLVAGFIGGHMLDEIFYHPKEIAERWYSLFMLWEGLSSFGGFTGALIGVLMWKYFDLVPTVHIGPWSLPFFRRRARPQAILPLCDVILAVFPVAWIFGRSGCSTVHDHPGTLLRDVKDPLHGALAVAYGPLHQNPDSWVATRTQFGPIQFLVGHDPRFDLGALELMFTCVLALCIALTWRKKLATGTYIVVTSLAYAPVRFAMDFLRIPEGESESADLRYGGLTPAQWECVALFVFGIAMLFYVRSLKKRGIDPMDDVMAAPTPDPRDGPLPNPRTARS
jgi:phosphatidylglycerol:prolipoprotein diacylglycerol transferase